MGDPDLVAAAVVLPAGEDDRARGRRPDGRTVVGGDVEAVVAVAEVLADVVAAAGDRPVEGAAAVGRRRPGASRRARYRCDDPDGSSAGGFGVGIALARRPGDDEDLADHEVRVVQLVLDEDVRGVDVVAGGQSVERVGGA